MTRGSDTYYYQTNAHGDVLSLTDETGAIVNTYSYDPWGKALSASEAVANPFRYATYYYDSPTGLYYLWHRYYDPETRRFLTLDPACLSTGERYSYCSENPVAFVDPSGLVDWGAAYYFLWGKDNYFFQQAYENGASWVHDFNPVYVILYGYGTGIDIRPSGGSWWDSFVSCMYGASGVEMLVTPFISRAMLSPNALNLAAKAGTCPEATNAATRPPKLEADTLVHWGIMRDDPCLRFRKRSRAMSVRWPCTLTSWPTQQGMSRTGRK